MRARALLSISSPLSPFAAFPGSIRLAFVQPFAGENWKSTKVRIQGEVFITREPSRETGGGFYFSSRHETNIGVFSLGENGADDTLGHGKFFRRTAYALSQVVLTKTDSGGRSFNVSEILGNGMEAGLANAYYPPQERGLRKTTKKWATGIESAALNNLVKEFWPDIRHKILRQK
jgi:hypothetical protein